MRRTLPGVERQRNPESFELGPRPRLIALLSTGSMTVMAGAAIAPVLPSLQAHFASEPQADLWVRAILTLPGLFTALAAPVVGVGLDRFGRRRLLLAATLLFTLAGSSGLFADSLLALALGRALLGVAVGAVSTAANTLAADYFAGATRRRVMSLQYMVTGASGIVFLSLAGALAEHGWRTPFLVYLFPLALLPLYWRYLAEPERQHAPSNSAHPRLPLASLALVYALGLWGMGLFYLIPAQLPYLLAELGPRAGFPATGGGAGRTGLVIGCFFLFSATAGSLFHRARARFSFPAIACWINLGTGLGYLVIAQATSPAVVVAGLALAGLGTGMMIPCLNVWMAGLAPERWRGRLLGGVTTSMSLGQFVSPILSQLLAREIGIRATFREFALGALAIAAALAWRARQGEPDRA